MNRRRLHWWLLLLLVPVGFGLARLRFDAEVLDLLPTNVPAVQGLKLYQDHFSNAQQLIITVSAPSREAAETAARALAESLRRETNLVAEVTWQPPWLEHPEQMAELLASLWYNQPPAVFNHLLARLAATNLDSVLSAARDRLATSLSPTDIAQLSYDPYGLSQLPESAAAAAPGFAEGQQLFASVDGTFRILFVKARGDLSGYRECTDWLARIRQTTTAALSDAGLRDVSAGYTGRPAFVAEISASMKHDICLSVGGTALIIAGLFWLAHRRWKPMLWLLALLALILVSTLALGGLWLGSIHVVSMGFAAILLGLAVDYAVVHYQEALAHPDLSIPQIRGAIAPGIFWAAITTIAAFSVLNLGGLPGLAQLGSLVGLGIALSAVVMIFAYLPSLFPDRWAPSNKTTEPAPSIHAAIAPRAARLRLSLGLTAALLIASVVIVVIGRPGLDASAKALQPRDSQAYATLDAIKAHLNQNQEPIWLVVAGTNETQVARRLDAVEPVLSEAVSNHLLAGFNTAALLWPRPANQAANRATARALIGERDLLRAAAASGGFAPDAMGLMDRMMDTWRRAAESTNVFWPTNPVCSWILDKLVSREPGAFYAAGYLFPSAKPPTSGADLRALQSRMPREGVWVSSWELLGETVLAEVRKNMWKLVLPMGGLVLLSLGLAFRRWKEFLLSLGVLALSGLCLLAIMECAGWSWNLLNLMAAPLILGTGVDYSIFMQLALRRHHGDMHMAHASVGRALLLCGGTAVSGFGSLAFSSNAGMASLGEVCAVGIGMNVVISVLLLPAWWKMLQKKSPAATNGELAHPSSLYGARWWTTGIAVARCLPNAFSRPAASALGGLYCQLAPMRRAVVVQNVLPVLGGDQAAAEQTARKLFREFAHKLNDLWRYESGGSAKGCLKTWTGWETLTAARARGKGVLLATVHLGNWEFGGAFLHERGLPVLIVTQPEPEARLTALRQQARSRHGIETLVVGDDPFAFVQIIKRLEAGTMVAIMLDRTTPSTTVEVELFGRPCRASIGAAELARASGAPIVPVYVVRESDGYSAHILPEVNYERAAIGTRAGRIALTQDIFRAFEPIIRQHVTQWYQFIPVWPEQNNHSPNS